MTTELKSFPILLACAPDGKLYLRWFIDRALLKTLAESSEADDVVFENTDKLLIEISAHDSIDDAQAECDRLKVQGAAMLRAPRGEA